MSVTLTDTELHLLYGPDAIVTHAEPFVLIHLDKPDVHTLAKRTAEFDPDTYFDCNCPICKVTKDHGVIVFDTFGDSNLEDVL